MLGTYHALNPQLLTKIRSLKGTKLRLFVGKLEDETPHLDIDKGWKALDPTFLASGNPLLHKAVFGGRVLRPLAQDIFLVEGEEVGQVAKALAQVTEEKMRVWFFSVPPEDFNYFFGTGESQQTEEEFFYTWNTFQGLPEFWANAASQGQAILFSVL